MSTGPGELPDPTGLLGADDLLTRLERWTAAARGDEAAAARTRERWMRLAAEESGTFAGVLLDLAEQRAAVVVRTVAGRHHRGVVEAVGSDFVALRTAEGTVTFVATGGIASVRADGRGRVAGDRAEPLEMGLAEALAAVAPDRPRVHLAGATAEVVVTGELVAAGVDVVTVRPDGGAAAAVVYVPVAAIVEAVLS